MRAVGNMAEEMLDTAGGNIHFMGIGGVGMAGLAAQLHWAGFTVSGCDLKQNRLTGWLQSLGIEFRQGHDIAHVNDSMSGLIRSTAVRAEHPEAMAAADRGVPVVKRGEALAAFVNLRRSVAISGTHGKTTTAAMLAQMLRACGMDAGFFIGAEVDMLGGVAGVGDEIFVAEADESDGTVAEYRPAFAVLTNADIDHLEHFNGSDDLWSCFAKFVGQASQCVVYNHDDRQAREICRPLPKTIGYGFCEGSQVRGSNFEQTMDWSGFDIECNGKRLGRAELPVSGLHNASNALATVAMGVELGLQPKPMLDALRRYAPPRRRFEKICTFNGAAVYQDYSHHPTEIRALLQSLQPFPRRRLLAVFQPHRYTRTLALGPDFPSAFTGVDELVLTPVFAASEDPLAGGTSRDLRRHFDGNSDFRVDLAESLEDAWRMIRSRVATGDMLLIIGAGDIEDMAFWARRESGGNESEI